ncbi:hypothetical protein L3Q82_015780, partial [Scortum barcoo]
MQKKARHIASADPTHPDRAMDCSYRFPLENGVYDQSKLHKNFLDDLSAYSYFASTRTIARIFRLCCSNQAIFARHTRQGESPGRSALETGSKWEEESLIEFV